MDKNMEATAKASVADRLNGLQYSAEKSDSFIIDVEMFKINHNYTNNDCNINANKEKSLSRKGSFRGEKKISSNNFVNDHKDIVVTTSSPRGPSTPEKATTATDHCSSPDIHHQIKVMTSNINSTTQGKCPPKRNVFKRPPTLWAIDPRRLLFFFATLSSMGTMLLIYFTLSISKLNAHEDALA